MQGLGEAGKRGFHVHEFGDVTNGCFSMGGHFNPTDKDHSSHTDKDRHVGDLKQIEASGQDITNYEYVDRLASLFGEDSIVGRGLVVHMNADDLGQGNDAGSKANGNSGPRVACCTIALAQKATVDD